MQRWFSEETRQWFAACVGTPTAVQMEGWPRIASGENVLISAPTGTGKTLTAFLTFIDRLKAQARAGDLADETQVLYISPLKALGNDVRVNLQRPNEGIAGEVLRTAVRTGDTTPHEREKMLKKPPHILITTPESLYLLLTAPRSRAMLRNVKAVIVDELHALIGSKRGAHMMLSLARLDDLCGRRVQRIGLSATISPLDRAAEYLSFPSPCAIVAPKIRKDADILVTSPLPDLRLIQGTVWKDLAEKVYDRCLQARTTIAFVEGRQQAERLAYQVNALAGEGFARTHHGCVSKEQRLEAERQFKNGELRLLCATSSMELGIDVGEVDLVLQVGNPRDVSGALQRLGRAGHKPGVPSVMRIYSKTAADTLACGFTATAAMEGGIEPSSPPLGCLDVLSQHLLSMAVAGDYGIDEALDVVRGCYSFQNITRADVEDCLRMLAGDWEHEQDRPVRGRVLYDRINGIVSADNYTRMIAYSVGGTIPDRGWYAVTLADGTHLGELDEEFVFEARVGDKFLLGAFAWKIQRVERDRVIVSQATADGAQPPFWKGDGVGRAYPVALRFGRMMQEVERSAGEKRLLQQLQQYHMDEDAAENAARHVRNQLLATGCLPNHGRIVCEHFIDDAGDHQMMVHSLFGRRVNYALSLLCKYEAQKITGYDIHIFDDDDGFLLYLVGGRGVPEGLLHRLDAENAVRRVRAMLPATPLFSMTFRYAAACAGMMGVRGGGRQPLWVQRLRGAEQLTALADKDEHPLIREARRCCEQDHLDFDALRQVLDGIRVGSIEVVEMHLDSPSPMALPMRRAAEAVLMYSYDNIPSSAVKAAQRVLEQQEIAAQEGIVPLDEALDARTRRRRLPENADQLHALLMTEGDLLANEIDVPIDWLTQLADRGRALYIEPGLWIAAEMGENYALALETGDKTALERIVRRCLRYRGGQDAEMLAQRYVLEEKTLQDALDNLVKEGSVVEQGGVYHHKQVYEAAQQDTLRARRSAVATQPPERFAALLAAEVRGTGAPREQLKAAMRRLCGQAFPLKTWENILLPARVSGYLPKFLDELLASGEYFWQVSAEGVSFHRGEDVDWEADIPLPGDLTEDEEYILRTLHRRGASFAGALSAGLDGQSALEPLLRLAHKGLVRCDSVTPLRIEEEVLSAGRAEGKRLAKARANALSAGRWELVRPMRALTNEEKVERAFAACPLLCRETVTGLPWAEAVEVLRVWEYTGRARRGYFVGGLSGMQFVRAEEYERVKAELRDPAHPALWLNAVDPDQPWGKALEHEKGAAFTRVPGTAVCLQAGRVIAIAEKNGRVLRVLEPEQAAQALTAFVRDHASKRIYADKDKITVKEYDLFLAEAFGKAGFSRVMLDFVLYR